MKNFINISDFTPPQILSLLDRAIADKEMFRAGKLPRSLAGKTLAMIFEKPSLRTRVSFESGMTQLAGHAISLTQSDIGLGHREEPRDIARVLSGMCDAIMARTFSHEIVMQLGQFAQVPVINGLTDYSHPCQAMADLMTVKEHFGNLDGKTIAFIGDGNNVARSLAGASVMLGVKFVIASPPGYELEEKFFSDLLAEHPDGNCSVVANASQAVASADVIYTDTWVSMGQEDEKSARQEIFRDFQINRTLLSKAPKGAIVLHCLPAYRECEITEEVFDMHSETIFSQAENRLHFQRSLLNVLIAEGGISDS